MIAREATLAVVDKELEGARAWVRRGGHELSWDSETLLLRVVMRHRHSGDSFYLLGNFESYPVLPPVLTFAAADGAEASEMRHFPNPEGQAPCGSWVFIRQDGKGVICAPFNRLSYTGPHKEWGDATHWRSVAPTYVQAHDVGSMLAAIDRDLQYTRGRMG